MIPSLPISINVGIPASTLPPIQYPPLWVHKEDIASGVFLNEEGNPVLRPCATSGGCPAVFVLREPLLKVVLNMHWQFALAGWNYGMIPADVATELHFRLAFANQTGLGNPNIPRNNYLSWDKNDTGYPENPRFDKDRTCSRSIMTGTEGYNLFMAIGETFQTARQAFMGKGTFRSVQKSLKGMLAVNNVLRVTVMDGNNPPALKPGKTYPQRIQDINPDDYLYTPRTHPWLFFAANTVSSVLGGGSRIFPFPRGVSYPWKGDGWKYTFMPHVARGTINYALSKLTKLQPGAPIPSPYRS